MIIGTSEEDFSPDGDESDSSIDEYLNQLYKERKRPTSTAITTPSRKKSKSRTNETRMLKYKARELSGIPFFMHYLTQSGVLNDAPLDIDLPLCHWTLFFFSHL